MRGVDVRCLVTITFADGLTLRVSDQSIAASGPGSAPDGNHYLGLLTELPEIVGGFDDVEKTNEPREMVLTFANAKRVDAYARFSDLLINHEIAFATVTLKWWLKGADASADLVTDFVGEAEGATSITADLVAVQVSGIEMSQRDPLPLWKLQASEAPDAPKASLGRIVPEIIGAVENVPVIPFDVGASSLLRENLLSTDTTIKLSDADGQPPFPASGTAYIGSFSGEQITWSGKTGNDLTGVVRGVNSTTALGYQRGTIVVEKKDFYTFLVSARPIKSINKVEIANILVDPGEVEINLNDSTLVAGRNVASIKLTVPALLASHQHPATPSEKTKLGTGFTDPNGGWNTQTNAFDGDNNTNAWSDQVPGVGDFPLNILFDTASETGTVVSAFWKGTYDFIAFPADTSQLFIGGQSMAKTSTSGDTKTPFSVPAPLNWSQLSSVDCRRRHKAGFNNTMRIWEIWLEVTEDGTGLAQTATADAISRIPLTVDGDGVYDSNECTGLTNGEITGTTGALIERPDHVVEFVQRVLAGRTAAEIDSASYTASGSTYATEGWLFAGMLNREWGAGELLARLAAEANSDQFWEGGSHRLLYDDPSPSASVTIEDRDLIGEVELSLTERDEIANIIEAHFERDYAEGLIAERQDAFLGLAMKEDATSKTSFGDRPLAAEFEFVRVQAHANDVSQRLLDKKENPRWLARVPLAWGKAAALERGDIIDLDIDLLATLSPRPLFKVVSITRSFQSEAWEVVALEVK
jgi:hypothetical protein